MAGRLSQLEFFQKPYSSTALPAATCSCCFKVQPGLTACWKRFPPGSLLSPLNILAQFGSQENHHCFYLYFYKRTPYFGRFWCLQQYLVTPRQAYCIDSGIGRLFSTRQREEEWWAQGRSILQSHCYSGPLSPTPRLWR